MFKKVILALVLGAASLMGASAQKAEITASYGAYTQMDATDMKDGWKHVNTAWGALNVGLNFRVTPKIWIGPSYTFSSSTTKGGPEHSNVAYHAVMLNGRYHYYRNSIVSLYAKVGLGVEFSYVGAQVDLSRDWAMFAEAGFGAQGLFQFGFKYKF